jgi:hypothetical protein
MANQHGGYRAPSNPAPVSGPGALSKRTDTPELRVSGLPYGENGAVNSAAASVQGGSAAPVAPAPAIVPLSAPTSRPDEPITAGAPFGPGPGPSRPQRQTRLTEMLSMLLGDDISGQIEELYLEAEAQGL